MARSGDLSLLFFLHAGILHLLFNIFAQLRFALYLERKWGTKYLAILYVISGIGGTLYSCLIRPNTVSVGASGALMGMLGAFFAQVILTWNKTDPAERRLNLIQAIFWIFVTFVFGFSKFVDTAAHAGGCITGFLCGMCLFSRELSSNRTKLIVMIVTGTLVLVQFVLGLTLFWTVVTVE